MGHMLFRRGDKSSLLMCLCNNVGNSHGGISHMTHTCWLHILSDCCSCDSLNILGNAVIANFRVEAETSAEKSPVMAKAGGRMLPLLLPFFF